MQLIEKEDARRALSAKMPVNNPDGLYGNFSLADAEKLARSFIGQSWFKEPTDVPAVEIDISKRSCRNTNDITFAIKELLYSYEAMKIMASNNAAEIARTDKTITFKDISPQNELSALHDDSREGMGVLNLRAFDKEHLSKCAFLLRGVSPTETGITGKSVKDIVLFADIFLDVLEIRNLDIEKKVSAKATFTNQAKKRDMNLIDKKEAKKILNELLPADPETGRKGRRYSKGDLNRNTIEQIDDELKALLEKPWSSKPVSDAPVQEEWAINALKRYHPTETAEHIRELRRALLAITLIAQPEIKTEFRQKGPDGISRIVDISEVTREDATVRFTNKDLHKHKDLSARVLDKEYLAECVNKLQPHHLSADISAGEKRLIGILSKTISNNLDLPKVKENSMQAIA